MAVVLVTGISGTGKSSVLDELPAAVTRSSTRTRATGPRRCRWTSRRAGSASGARSGSRKSLRAHPDGTLFLSGCVRNQGRFYPSFDAVVLLSAPAAVILGRIASRVTNPFGKSEAERDLILGHLATVEPLLRATATDEIDATKPLAEVADELEAIAQRPAAQGSQPSR